MTHPRLKLIGSQLIALVMLVGLWSLGAAPFINALASLFDDSVTAFNRGLGWLFGIDRNHAQIILAQYSSGGRVLLMVLTFLIFILMMWLSRKPVRRTRLLTKVFVMLLVAHAVTAVMWLSATGLMLALFAACQRTVERILQELGWHQAQTLTAAPLAHMLLFVGMFVLTMTAMWLLGRFFHWLTNAD